jgi:hypothetical protein
MKDGRLIFIEWTAAVTKFIILEKPQPRAPLPPQLSSPPHHHSTTTTSNINNNSINNNNKYIATLITERNKDYKKQSITFSPRKLI